MAKKRKPKADGAAPIDLEKARLERLARRFRALMKESGEALDRMVALVLEAYRAWERGNPERALHGYQRMEMVRLGFVGPGGFQRCHEEGRLPRDAFDDDDPAMEDDREAADLLMCPAMEGGRCEPIWTALQLPPCQLLLLEIHQAVGASADDVTVQSAVGDFGRWPPGEQERKNFARAERLLRKARGEDEGDR